jgi:hypothetical protein
VALLTPTPSASPRTSLSGSAWDDGISRRRARWATGAGIAAAAVVFFAVLLDFATDVQRQATGLGFASQFFDLQAEAIRDGHLWVPKEGLGIEGFEVDGKTYLYFGIFPALLRLPVLLITDDYTGKLTLISMALAWVVLVVVGTRLFWLLRECLARPRHLTRLEAVLAGLFLAGVFGGSVVTFDASLPWVYHEVYLWSLASVVGSLYWLLRVLREPSPTAISWLFVFVLVASLTRTTGGWAVCLVTLVAGLWLLTGRLHQGARRTGVAVLAAALVPWGAAVVVNYLKFKHPFLFPLEDQVWTQLNGARPWRPTAAPWSAPSSSRRRWSTTSGRTASASPSTSRGSRSPPRRRGATGRYWTRATGRAA